MAPQNAPRLHSMRNSRRAWCCLVIWSVGILVSIDVSTATWSPHRPPLEAHHRLHQFRDRSHALGVVGKYTDALRGGSMATKSQPPQEPPLPQQDYQEEEQELLPQEYQHQQTPPPPPQPHEEKPFVPTISLKYAAKALLHTSEWNRRLLQGVKHWGRHRQHILSYPSHHYIEHQNHHPEHDAQQSKYVYGNIPVNVHPSRTWNPPIQASSGRFLEEEELSLFHAKTSRSETASQSDSRPNEINDETEGASHWGPELLPYLEHISEMLDIEADGVEVCLAMIYLDRACSVETLRSNGVPPCPFCAPRTVHRLGLAALLVAVQAVRGDPHEMQHPSEQQPNPRFRRLSQSLGIPDHQLEEMVHWMQAALGDEGMYVTFDEMKRWSQSWESIFSS
ncbi:unnamed protein product [Pseudo-nitzschia multistriata]|uniref:Uncharacterized protein n=1 Tax=Pseudo-nitzschia multistriata TaxID=183589 RepID=A0A448ZKP4_9STRA|nr:unnamed protein product [Pseudo-nitzschia multistriata]